MAENNQTDIRQPSQNTSRQSSDDSEDLTKNKKPAVYMSANASAFSSGPLQNRYIHSTSTNLDGENDQNKQQEPIKQFSQKTLHELADYYLDMKPVDIPDTGFVVSGIAGRFPAADNMNELWDNLLNGHDMVTGPDDKRWPLGLWDLPKKAARVKDVSRFDNEFFGIPKEQADYTDHQLRNLYEVVYESMLDAGINPASLRGDKRTGIFFGFHTNEVETEFYEKPNFKSTGYQSQLLTAITNYFDIKGHAGSYDAACASSFAAFHQAVLNLKAGLIDTAIVCGVNISVRPGTAYQFLLLQMLSPTGSSKFLDAAADGYAKTEACVSVILQRKDSAKRLYASIVHTKCNNDGFKIEGITYPSSAAQEALMNEAIIEAGVDPRDIVYVEAHGTGTPAGDPEEARAIAKVYCGSNRSEPLLIGSVKSNMGHAEGVSGLCSLAKVICTFENELLPRNLHFNKPNPNIQPLMEGRIKPVIDNIPFKHNLIPMNCYGFGGVNVHGIFKSQAKRINKETDYDIAPDYPRLICMFGRSQQAVEYAFDELKTKAKQIMTKDFLSLIDSINEGPIDKLMNYRGYLLMDNDLNELAQSVTCIEDGIVIKRSRPSNENAQSIYDCRDNKNADAEDNCDILEKKLPHPQDFSRPIWFILPGLGCQWKGMAKQLLTFRPVWATIEKLDLELKPFGVDLVKVLTQSDTNMFQDSVVNLFTSIVAIQVALIDLLNLLEVRADGIIGHSIGEISCAYADGVLSAEETIKLAYYLAAPIDETKFHLGAMASASLSIDSAEQYLEQFQKAHPELGAKFNLEVACHNGDESITISGDRQQVDSFLDMLTEESVYARRIADVKTAFHNSSLRQLEEPMMSLVNKIFTNGKTMRSNKWISTLIASPYVSAPISLVTRKPIRPGTQVPTQFDVNARYFVDNLCSQVKFNDALTHLPSNSIIIEIGPHGLFQPILKRKYLTKLNYVSFMKRMDGSIKSLLMGVGQLYQHGSPIKLMNLYPKCEYPVAKGTASLSSLIRWNHGQKFYVAKYPEAFRKPPCETRVKFDLIDESDKFIAGHCVDGRVLFPATGYLYLVWRAFSLTKDKVGNSPIKSTGETILVPVEFINVRLYRATILGSAPVELLVRIEEATGQFEVREGGQVVADGYISLPTINPDGLLYEALRDDPSFKGKDMTLKTDDVYKQFRVCGYDYGETFRNILQASSDGLHVQVKWTGQFITFSDSVLQSLFLAICKKTSALFLPTKFEYMRINPRLLNEKIVLAQEREEPCILDAYCELETGIIVTDGIEMRGVGASPAPRRLQQEPQTEAYQFVPHLEDNIQDLFSEAQNTKVEQYMQMCSTAAYRILSNLKQSQSQIVAVMNGFKIVDDVNLRKYLDDTESSEQHILLQALDRILASQEAPISARQVEEIVEEHNEPAASKASESAEEISEQNADKTDDKEGKESQDKPAEVPKRNRVSNPALRSIQELQEDFDKVVKSEFEAAKAKLGQDLLSSTFSRERSLRPIIEVAFENTCSQKVKLLELNSGDALKYDPIATITGEVMPNLSINYFLGHPNTGSLSSGNLPPDTKLYTWTPASKSMARELQDIDLVIYSDSSCYATKKDQFLTRKTRDVVDEVTGETSEVEEVFNEDVDCIFDNIHESLRPGGFLVVFLRCELSPAERFLYKVADYEVKQTQERMNLILMAGDKTKLKLLLQKSDPFGCSILLFRKCDDNIKLEEQTVFHLQHDYFSNWVEPLRKAIAEISNKQSTETQNKNIWLLAKDTNINGLIGMMNCLKREPGGERLRYLFDMGKTVLNDTNLPPYPVQEIAGPPAKPEDETDQEKKADDSDKTSKQAKEAKQEPDKKSEPEPEPEPEQEPVLARVDPMELDEKVVELIKLDMVNNCIDESGRYGSYRHFTINEILDNLKVRTCESYVNVGTRGDLSSFKWYEAPYKYCPKREKEKNMISVYYSSLNFRDIMLASGRLPLDALPVSIALSDCILGLEYSGREPDGTRVAGMCSGRGICTSILYREEDFISFKVPDHMSLEEAATIPCVYYTVVMALVYRGKVKAGETILIHSGSGGVGQAAIRLALHYGLKVYTTVGNKEKREFLKEEFPQLTDAHIFNSRDITFETDIMRATRGRGVDLVLNSLSEDKLQASVRCLADGGRFLEIGKYDMALNNPVELLLMDTNKTFHGILLDKLFDIQTLTPSMVESKLYLSDIIEDGLEKGYIKPIKRTIFDKDQIEDAFRFMASGKHIGKVVIKIRDEEMDQVPTSVDEPMTLLSVSPSASRYKKTKPTPLYMDSIPRAMFDAELSYIITGGLGGFGLELCKWICTNGARKIVLTSRSGIKSGYQALVVERLRDNKVEVLISTQDNTTEEGAYKLVEEATRLGPLGGIFNLAMVLKDKMFENMSAEDFKLVCAPKCAGVLALDRVCRKLCPNLPLFVAFSSVSCGKGNAGQANYGYANSVMERICELRRRDGLHGLAIQWGAIGDVGVAFENLGGNDAVIGGTIPQRMPSCFVTLSKFLTSPFAVCLSIIQADRRSFSTGKKGDLVKTILHVLGIKDPSTVDPNCTLGELGLDSLMAVEIKNALEREYEVVLSVQDIRALTINRIREIGEAGIKKKDETGASAEGGVSGGVPVTDELGLLPGQAAGASVSGVTEAGKQAANQTTDTTGASNGLEQSQLEEAQKSTGVLSGSIETKVPGVICHINQATGERHYTIDKQMAIKAPLALPSEELLLLNGDNGIKLSGNPIFFLPPIHGDFSRLSLISKKLHRPCLGISWTKRMSIISELEVAAQIHVDIIRQNYPQLRQLDLVGYSFGASIAYEIMINIQKNKYETPVTMKTGKLVLLDGSPHQNNIGVRYLLQRMEDNKDESERVAEVMTIYLMQHSRFDYVQLKKQILSHKTNELKLSYATDVLAKALGFKTKEDIDELSSALEAFCRRFQIMLNYTVENEYFGDVTLIRASEIYIGNKEQIVDEDYGLRQIVRGRVNSCTLKGNHESFLDDNIAQCSSLLEDIICPHLMDDE